MKKFLLFTIQFLQLLIFFCLMSAAMLYLVQGGEDMPRKIKPVISTCIYCRKEITFPGEGAEMSKPEEVTPCIFIRYVS